MTPDTKGRTQKEKEPLAEAKDSLATFVESLWGQTQCHQASLT